MQNEQAPSQLVIDWNTPAEELDEPTLKTQVRILNALGFRVEMRRMELNGELRKIDFLRRHPDPDDERVAIRNILAEHTIRVEDT